MGKEDGPLRVFIKETFGFYFIEILFDIFFYENDLWFLFRVVLDFLETKLQS